MLPAGPEHPILFSGAIPGPSHRPIRFAKRPNTEVEAAGAAVEDIQPEMRKLLRRGPRTRVEDCCQTSRAKTKDIQRGLVGAAGFEPTTCSTQN
jgi:hypothetical protein